MRPSTLSSLQLFQLTRYLGFVLIGISFAKLGMPKNEISRFELFLWLMGLFSFWVPGLMNSMLALYPAHTEEDKKKLLFTTFCLILALSAVGGVVQFFVGGAPLGLVYLLFNNASYVIEYILFLNDRRRQLIIYGICIAVLQLLLCVVPAYIYGDTTLSIYGLAIAALVKFIYIALLLRRHTHIIYEQKRITQLLMLSLPLMLSFMVTSSAEFIDGAVVTRYFTLADFSVFRYGSREFPLFAILAATLSMSMIPRISENLNSGMEAIRAQSLRYMHLFFPLAIILILSGHWLYSIFFSAQFADSGRVFAALMLLTIPRLLFPQTILTALQENRLILYSSIIEMLINIVASVILAKYYGLAGVAYGTVIAYTAEKAFMAGVLYMKHKIIFTQYVAIVPFAIYSIITCLSYLFSLYL